MTKDDYLKNKSNNAAIPKKPIPRQTYRTIQTTLPRSKCPKCNSSNIDEWEESDLTVGYVIRYKKCKDCRLQGFETWKLTNVESWDVVDARITRMTVTPTELKDYNVLSTKSDEMSYTKTIEVKNLFAKDRIKWR